MEGQELNMKNLVEQFIPKGFPTLIKDVKWNDEDSVTYFHLEINCEANDFERWIFEFQSLTKTNYTVRKDMRNGHKFNRNLRATCHHQTYGVRSVKYGSKNTQCPSKLIIKNLRPLVEGMKTHTEVTVKFNHNHPLVAADVLRFRKPCSDIEQKFISLFESGHTPATAIQANIFDIILKHADYKILLADNAVCPNYQWVSRLYKKQAENSYGSKDSSIKEQGELILKIANQKGCDARLVEDEGQIAVVLVTKMMKRISQMKDCAEICFVDSSGGVDKEGTRFFIFLGKCHAGGVPLGIILTTSECESLLTLALETFKQMLPFDAFGGRSNICGPQLIMTDDCSAERNALQKTWPNSTLLLCIFHVLQALWRWLFDGKHAISFSDRRHLYTLVKDMLYANSKFELQKLYDALQKDQIAIRYPNFIKHVDNLYGRKSKWALCHREDFLVRGYNTNNICEAAMMVMKEYVLQRVKAFNMVQLADFVISRLDLYFEKKILNVAFNRLTNQLMIKKAYMHRNVEFAKNRIIKICDNIFSVPSEKDANKMYNVNMDLACCECFIGKDGKFCKHQTAVITYIGVENINVLPVKNPKQKQYLYYVATGKTMDLSFFHSLRPHEESSQPKSESVNEIEVMEATCSKYPKISENVCQSDKGMEVFDERVDDTDKVMEATSLNNPEISKEVVSTTENNLRLIFNDLVGKLQSKNEIYLPAIQKFVEKYNSFSTDTNIVSSLHNFGASLKECTTNSASVYAVKRKGKKIRVQPTAISRRRQHMALGKGSRSAANTGRPRKQKLLTEHAYAASRQLKIAPHKLASCIKNNRSIGKKH